MDILRSPSKQLSNRQTAVFIISIFILGAALRLYRLGYQSLWTDEVLTFLSSKGTLSNVLFQTDTNTNIQPLYYVVVNAVLRVGNQDALLRLPSVVFGSLTILTLYFVVANWLGKTSGIICALLLAISPFHIWYSQEARPYALLIFLALLSMGFLQESLKRQGNLWLKLGFIISTASTFYCHTIAIPFIAFLGTYLLLTLPPKEWKIWIPVFAGIALLVLPGLYRMLIIPPNASADVYRSFSLSYLSYMLWTFMTGYSLGPTISELHRPDRMNYVMSYIPIILPIMLFISLLILLGAFNLWRQNRLVFWSAFFLFLFPLAFAVLGSIVTVHPFNIRYTILSFLPFLVFFGFGVSSIIFLVVGVKNLKFKWARATTLTIIGVITAFSLNNYFFDDRYHKENNRAAGQFLTAQARQNDLVICSAPYTARNLKHYSDPSLDLDSIGYPIDKGFVEFSTIESDLARITADRDKFWLFLSRTFHSDPNGYLRQYCDLHFLRELDFKSNGVELILYRKS